MFECEQLQLLSIKQTENDHGPYKKIKKKKNKKKKKQNKNCFVNSCDVISRIRLEN